MKILDLYIGKSVLVGVFFVFLVLLALDTLIGFASESDYIGYKQYTFWHALGYVLLLMPQHMYELFPMITLLGSIVSLGALANSSELVVIRAAGVSTYSLIFSVMKTAFLLML
ncbi:MAG: LptF/LptG family permease, partial [Gammaproteobacteria bacterium]|nr:LptF/LptG family permease [Gammaproteobacteria bacterium]